MKRRFISLLNLEIHPCPRKERGISTSNAPEVLLDKPSGARLPVPGVGWNNSHQHVTSVENSSKASRRQMLLLM